MHAFYDPRHALSPEIVAAIIVLCGAAILTTAAAIMLAPLAWVINRAA